MDVKRALLAFWLLVIPHTAWAKSEPPPSEPPSHPNWGETAQRGVEMLKSKLLDPGSAQITWSSGFQWGYKKPIIGRRTFGWVACGSVNAKNTLGGYAGPSTFIVFIDANGAITADWQSEWVSTCDTGPFVAAQPGLIGSAPALAPSAPLVGVADELAKLAQLRNSGIISEVEFQAQKSKLLGR